VGADPFFSCSVDSGPVEVDDDKAPSFGFFLGSSFSLTSLIHDVWRFFLFFNEESRGGILSLFLFALDNARIYTARPDFFFFSP